MVRFGKFDWDGVTHHFAATEVAAMPDHWNVAMGDGWNSGPIITPREGGGYEGQSYGGAVTQGDNLRDVVVAAYCADFTHRWGGPRKGHPDHLDHEGLTRWCGPVGDEL